VWRVVCLVAEQKEPNAEEKILPPPEPVEAEVAYWITPVRSDEEQTAEECIQTLVGQERIHTFGERSSTGKPGPGVRRPCRLMQRG